MLILLMKKELKIYILCASLGMNETERGSIDCKTRI